MNILDPSDFLLLSDRQRYGNPYCPRCPLCREPIRAIASERDVARRTWTVRGSCCGRELAWVEMTYRALEEQIENASLADLIMEQLREQVAAVRLYVIEEACAPHFER